ncbi:UDP-N-acetylglucosamine 2-epimerase [Waltera sp.]|jgi:GDP/UDP-N,N'-diacetylbacillosamine 2-epimerase (hydrolysing)|uniref:UDP-N-acetylglucosamine 2-epimerase n=1 Tax=Waltera sp. TaxID=2815806 RepID=UPI0003409DEB|nr:uDP-N-acetyl-D-glucosamine 2-epimerase UDP-hydrolysing [Clostridium sp. CAG:91]
MKKIVVLTATRAEYGLLAPVIKKMDMDSQIDVRVVVTGAHLSPEFGMTINEIKEDGVRVDKEIDILLSSDTPAAISKTMGLAMIGFADYFAESKPDALMVLGDRYETLAVCAAAMNAQIPIVHLYGGEATEGLIDEAVRNAITKLSYLHFTSTEEYRHRVIQMGENPQRVYTAGAIGVENALHTNFMSKQELEKSLECSLGEKIAVLTFHPVTLEHNTAEIQIGELIKAIKHYPEITFICTKANADMSGRIINDSLQKCAETQKNIILFDSLGLKRYLSLLSYAEFVIGNSSSGIIEVPSFKIPTINIGDRQKGRTQARSVINCIPKADNIIEAISTALSEEFKNSICNIVNPYGDGNASEVIVNVTKEFLLNNKLKIQKSFYDIT